MVKTVKICGSNDEPEFMIINAEDFDEATMTLYVEPETATDDDDDKAEVATPESLMKHSKNDLLALAEEAGIEIPVPDDVTKAQIVAKLLAAAA